MNLHIGDWVDMDGLIGQIEDIATDSDGRVVGLVLMTEDEELIAIDFTEYEYCSIH